MAPLTSARAKTGPRTSSKLFVATALFVGASALALMSGSGLKLAFAPGGGVVNTNPQAVNDWTNVTNNVNPPRLFAGISSGWYFSCVIKIDGTVWCWGDNTHSQIGLPANQLALSRTPLQIKDTNNVPLSNVIQIATYIDRTCALKADGTVWCWGANVRQYPDPIQQLQDTANALALQQFASPGVPLTQVTKITVGAHNACAIKTDRTAWCWTLGSILSYYGLGVPPTTVNVGFPVQVSGPNGAGKLQNVFDIASGDDHTCALTRDIWPNGNSKLWCWGSGQYGALGTLNVNFSFVPVQVLDPINRQNYFLAVKRVFVGDGGACAIDPVDYVACWGNLNNIFKMWPLGSAQPLYVLDANARAIKDIVATSISMDETFPSECLLKKDGSAWCWGSNSGGQLGNNSVVDSYKIPVQVVAANNAGILGLSAISTGRYHSCALWKDNQVGCWGGNSQGDLGNTIDPNAPFSSVPVLVTFP